MVTLHQWEISPFCQKVARMLKFKGIEFETIDYNGVLGAKVPMLSKVGKVPVLDINGQRIQDSTRIARYLDDTYPDFPRLYPLDPIQKAYAELWEDWADELLYFYEIHFRVSDADALDHAVAISAQGRPKHEVILMKPLLKSALSFQLKMQGTGRMAKADIEAEFIRHLERIELVLSATGWLVGEQKTVADIAVASQLLEIVRTSKVWGAKINSYSNISAWIKQI
ncbi:MULTISPECIES: glutathione S-transferase family protein [Acinetobacter]|uniref:glutathione S-transferase family protein n=1 Tax=Acinetobacter TaxID=469 RepID=UPI00019ADBC7|nr:MULTISPECIES: glutathione S-transferase family protein [Acinetobacter]EEH69233.1 glutathione S-transferase, N-terminal domain protein [Acinetobacter sp. ATCC 27244]NAR53137.1 glutathione S-transferase family protein [Acinetobacter haemolyticus]NAR59852.1 glutathione S-transferase family protein [Acinetobacter haemolyticus]NAR85334.1 glutathione S-transferase family protein [Acinetobacter haemolyticus]NAR94087.1 glutathione S-transferase family protein [Acinetobacter haemolyticus]